MLALHQNPITNAQRNAPNKVTGHMTIYERTGVDASSSWIVEWPAPSKGAKAPHAVCTSSMVASGSRESAVVVQMEKADVHITCESNSAPLCKGGTTADFAKIGRAHV